MMKCIKNKVNLALERGNIGSNLTCEYHPCHYKGQNCSFCYCPFFPCNDPDLGHSIESRSGNIWDCSPCLFNHRNDVVEYSFKRFSELSITCADDPRIKDVFIEAKERFFHKARAVMVLGATSDAGKSITATAICRILQRRGFVVTPFKSQNMSLNSNVTKSGCEVAMAQFLQSKAAGLSNPDYNINPILLKPKGDKVSQVIVEGKPYRDYSVDDYYNDFIPNEGFDIVKRNVDFLSKRYDYIIMEGAGSPAEINLYDKDIANMRAAEIADADCILVINMEYGGSFAHAAGTLGLLTDEDRKRVKGIILNNVRGDVSGISNDIGRFEDILKVPILGVIPHIDVDLPKEDSEYFRDCDSKGNGKKKICVIRLPRISNFTDVDPLILEDVTVRFVTSPSELDDADAIIIPGSKDTFGDLRWLKDKGLFDAIEQRAGTIPVLGICGGYQMMAKELFDPNNIENDTETSVEGLGLFNNTVKWDTYNKHVSSDHAVMNIGDHGNVDGYQLHMGFNHTSDEKSLFTIRFLNKETPEGSVNEERKLYGTFLHGIFERPAFRRYFMSLIGCTSEGKDYSEYLNENIDRLTDSFEDNLNYRFWDLIGVKR